MMIFQFEVELSNTIKCIIKKLRWGEKDSVIIFPHVQILIETVIISSDFPRYWSRYLVRLKAVIDVFKGSFFYYKILILQEFRKKKGKIEHFKNYIVHLMYPLIISFSIICKFRKLTEYYYFYSLTSSQG